MNLLSGKQEPRAGAEYIPGDPNPPYLPYSSIPGLANQTTYLADEQVKSYALYFATDGVQPAYLANLNSTANMAGKAASSQYFIKTSGLPMIRIRKIIITVTYSTAQGMLSNYGNPTTVFFSNPSAQANTPWQIEFSNGSCATAQFRNKQFNIPNTQGLPRNIVATWTSTDQLSAVSTAIYQNIPIVAMGAAPFAQAQFTMTMEGQGFILRPGDKLLCTTGKIADQATSIYMTAVGESLPMDDRWGYRDTYVTTQFDFI